MQLGFDFMRKAPQAAGPTIIRTETGKHSYAQIVIVPNSDGTWSEGTGDHFQGYCGHGYPAHGSYASFDMALKTSGKRLARSWTRIANETRDSVCTETHRTIARRALAWLETVLADHGIDMSEITNDGC